MTGVQTCALPIYTLDFLTRARSIGYAVPGGAYRLGLDWLKSVLVDGPAQKEWAASRPYALYVLVKAGRTEVAGAARYLADNHAGRLPYAARGHLAASPAALAGGQRPALLDRQRAV